MKFRKIITAITKNGNFSTALYAHLMSFIQRTPNEYRHNPYIHGHYLNLQLGQGPPSFLSLSFPSLPLLLFPLLFSSLPLEVGPLLHLVGPGDRFSSPSVSGQSPAAKRYLVNFRLKISPQVATIFRSFTRNETSNWGEGDWSRVVTYLCMCKQTV